jgi:hypothetical protein
LALLLSEGAPVLYVAYKSSKAYLFIPRPDGIGYRGWLTLNFKESRLTGDVRMIVLMDPPEESGYDWKYDARLVKVCSNNHDRHFLNLEKYVQIKPLYSAMPKLDEIFAMAKVLWKDETSSINGKACKDEKEKLNILAMRAYLVGCAPHYLFDFKKYRLRLKDISDDVEALLGTEAIPGLFRIAHEVQVIRGGKHLADVPSKFYDLDGGDIVVEGLIPTVTLNGHARGHLLAKHMNDKPSPVIFEQFVEECLLLGGTFQMKQLTFDYTFTPVDNGKKLSLKWTTETVVLPCRKWFSAKDSDEDSIRATIQNLQPGVVFSTREYQSYPVLDFATSQSEWWNAKGGVNKNAKLEYTKLVSEMKRHGLKKVTITIVGFGKIPATEWPFKEAMKTVDEEKWAELEGITVRLWYLTSPRGTVNLELLASQCKDGIFGLLPSQTSAIQQPSFAASLLAATTDEYQYQALSVILKKNESFDTNSTTAEE